MKIPMSLKVIAAAMALGLATLSNAGAVVLYNQPFDGLGNGYSSQNDTNGNGNFATVYDNFALGGNSNINNVMFTGEYFNPPNQGPITAWTVSFYANNAGQPGGLLQSFNIGGTGNETFLGTFNGFPTYTYSINLAGGFNALAGTTYWMSVVPDLGFPPQWGWSSGLNGDGISYQDFFGARSQLAADMAFTLNGNAVGAPESGSTVVLLGVAMLVVGLLHRRIKAATNKA
jgi:hypothetical protein